MKSLQKLSLAALLALTICAQASAGLQKIEGRGIATNPFRRDATFAMNVMRDGDAAPTGSFEAAWRGEHFGVRLVMRQVGYMGTSGHFGRFSGRATAFVSTENGNREIEGAAFVSVWDLHVPGEPDTRKDSIRIRFIRDPFGNPEFDHFFQGLVTTGNIVVRRS